MAKTYEELLEQAAIIRDETAAGKNTATRVGGTITDAVDYVKELQDTYAGIHAEAAEAKTEAAAASTAAQEAKDTADSAKQTADAASITANAAKTESAQAVSTAQAAQNKNAEQDNRLKHAEEQNTKQNERLLNYVYPKLYQLNEGAGARVFNGFTKDEGVGSLINPKETYRYSILYSTKQKQFVLNVTDEASGIGVRVGVFAIWREIYNIDKTKKIVDSSDSYALRDCLYYIYVEGEGSTYYYIDSNGVASEKSATYLLRLLANKNAAEITKLKTITENSQNKLNNYSDTFPQNPVASLESNGLMSAADKAKVGNYPEQFVLDLGILNSQSEGENIAAASEVAGNRNISFIRFQVQGVSELKTTLIMQWPNGIHVTAQIMCVDKTQWRRNVTGATGVVGATTTAYTWERTAPHKIDYNKQRRTMQLKDYENQAVSQEVELPLATSSQSGLMSIADKEKISAMESKLSALEARVAALEAR